MALILKDRVRESCTSPGTGAVSLQGAALGYQTFSAAIGDGNTTFYTIADQGGSRWEVGIGAYSTSGNSLARNTILASSNSNAIVDFDSGSQDVFVTYPAGKSVNQDAAGDVNISSAVITTATLTNGTISSPPSSSTDIVNKTYVDNIVAVGVSYHTPVRVESPTALTPVTYNNGTSGVGATLTNAGTQAALVIDGVTLNVSDRVLIYTQTDATQNGIYTVTDTGSGSTNWVLTRATDADSYGLVGPDVLGEGSAVYVSSGSTGAGETYVCNTAGTITFGTTNITFAQISASQIYSAGTGLTLTNTTFSLTVPVTAANGGTGLTSPGANGNVLTSNGSAWVSSAPSGTSKGQAIAFSLIFGL